jgi:hypothetical protein
MIRGITTPNENGWRQAYSTLKQRRVEGRLNLVFDSSPDVSLTREPIAASPTVAPFVEARIRDSNPARFSRRLRRRRFRMQVLYRCCCGLDVHAQTAS